jgi:hypothetical protein
MAKNLTVVRLLSVPLENDYMHTIYFAEKANQESFFTGQTKFTANNCTYQRKDKVIRFPKQFDDIADCNYVMYKNSAYSDKWYYAFINKMEYKNDELTEVYIETDVIQTYLFDYHIQPSFIEREHVDSDEVGEHTVSEMLETGDYVCGTYNKANYAPYNKMMIVVGYTQEPNGDGVTGNMYDNLYSGVKYRGYANNTEGIRALNEFITSYASEGAIDAITCLFLAPQKLGYREGNPELVYSNLVHTEFINVNGVTEINTDIAFTTNMFDGYIPRNKKLLCYPYRYLLASNNNGGSAVYKFELFKTKSEDTVTMLPPEFEIIGSICVGCSVRLIPRNYNGVKKNHLEALSLGKFPALNWTSDVYTNWLTQNSVNIATQVGAGLLQAGVGVASIVASPVSMGTSAMIGASLTANGASMIASTLGEVYQHSLQPPQAEGNINSGDVVTATGDNDFHFYEMTIKREMAEIIDGYFDMYGYKVNRIGVPHFMHRNNYWYTKTIGVNIDGNVPMEDMKKIKQCYDNGITFWINPAYMGDYSIDNHITG